MRISKACPELREVITEKTILHYQLLENPADGMLTTFL
jgi:hypothetical protein